MLKRILIGSAILLIATPAIAGTVAITAQVMVEKRVAAADGTTRIELARADRVTPGDRVVYVLEYRNGGTTAATDLVVANPVPVGLAYVGPAAGTPIPDVSVDGKAFAPIAQVRVRGANGALRAAVPGDVRIVRWHLTNPVAPGSSGKLSFRATLK